MSSKSIKKLVKEWLYVDTRTLALFRITFGFMGLFDVLRRFGVIDVFYSNAGMDFRRYVTGKYSIKYFTYSGLSGSIPSILETS